MEDHIVYLYTDGAALNNGKKSCRAAWAVFVAVDSPLNASGEIFVKPSNQHAELLGCLMALRTIEAETLPNADWEKARVFDIVTDSLYSINCITKWSKAWARNGYKTKNGKDVKHSKLIKDIVTLLDRLKTKHHVCFTHVNSHQCKPPLNDKKYHLWFGNNQADKAARNVLTKYLTNVLRIDVGQPQNEV